jgi:hypothetical protein
MVPTLRRRVSLGPLERGNGPKPIGCAEQREAHHLRRFNSIDALRKLSTSYGSKKIARGFAPGSQNKKQKK